MKYEEDFAIEETVGLEIEGYTKGSFKYKPTNAAEENKWIDQYIKISENGKITQDLGELNKLKLNNLVCVPYDKELVKKIVNIEKEWKDMNIEERWLLLGKLKGKVFDKILRAINKVDNPKKKKTNYRDRDLQS